MAEKELRAVLVGANFTSGNYGTSDEDSISELIGLLETAGGHCAAYVIQSRPVPDSATFIGSGKAQEIAELAVSEEAGLIVFDNELQPTHIRNLEKIIGVRVLDRSMLILDIFAMRAKTKEGKLQTELAQYKYLLPRLTASKGELSRLGGGIGTRGPGESKLETDRRHIRERVRAIEEEIKDSARTRDLQREGRKKGGIPIIAIIGYTNAGKSTLFNLLTQESVLAEDKLFATLDPVTRKIEISEGMPVLVTDTVGFIKKLPHHLIRAFKSTLEEIKYADVLLHVVDAASPFYSEHIKVSQELIGQLGASEIPSITVFNKCDMADISEIASGLDTVCISAKTGEGMAALLDAVTTALSAGKKEIRLIIPYTDYAFVDYVHKNADIISERHLENAVELVILAEPQVYGRLKTYIPEAGDGV